MVLEFYTSVAKGLKLKARNILGQISAFAEVIGEKLEETFRQLFFRTQILMFFQKYRLILQKIERLKNTSKEEKMVLQKIERLKKTSKEEKITEGL